MKQSIKVKDTPMFHIDNRTSNQFVVGQSTEINDLEITGLKMVQFIFSGCYQYYEEPSIFDVDTISINGMKFKRIKDE
jgi:hypothetical protein